MEQESQNTEPLYDVFYADRDRLISYLAQIDPNGAITSVKTTITDSESTQTNASFSVKILKGGAGATEQSADGTEKIFDPAMVIPFTIMDALNERGFIGRDITKAPLGSIVLFSGSMRIKELTHSPIMWPLIEKNLPFHAFVENTNGMTRAEKEAVKKKSLSNTEIKKIMEEFFKSIVHPIQIEMKGNGLDIWGTLKESSLCASISDIGFKYSSVVPGEWHMLCIVDCLPGEMSHKEENLWSTGGNSFSDALNRGITAFKKLFGRPEKAYGITPLIVFRKTCVNR